MCACVRACIYMCGCECANVYVCMDVWLCMHAWVWIWMGNTITRYVVMHAMVQLGVGVTYSSSFLSSLIHQK